MASAQLIITDTKNGNNPGNKSNTKNKMCCINMKAFSLVVLRVWWFTYDNSHDNGCNNIIDSNCNNKKATVEQLISKDRYVVFTNTLFEKY